MEQSQSKIYQVIAKLLDGKSRTLNFETPIIPISYIKSQIQNLTSIPIHHQILLSNGKTLSDDGFLHRDDSSPSTVHLLLRLRGGKGGFGSLLRGAATKAGQKKTNNFDACRDMSGRRLRHVNAEKKMEEWLAEEKERKLEKVAEEFIKKKVKTVKKAGGGGDGAEKYVEKYRKDSAKCMEDVDKSVRESLAGGFLKSKRKVGGLGMEDGSGLKSKKLKIWMGKRKVDDSDSDDMASSGLNMDHLPLAFVILTLCWAGSMAQSGCTNVLIGMAPCLTYVTGSSKTPSSSCCSSLASVVKSQPQCLCTAIDGSTMTSLGISINKTIALSLPHVCNVKTPPVSRCNAENNAPTMAPIKSPEDESAKAPTPTIFAGGPTAQSGCTNVLIGMAPCLNYVTGSSKTPSSSCCSSLASVVKSQPQCLCTAIDGSTMASLGININKTIALSLPRACNMKTPPVSRCNAGTNAPTMAPIKSPEDKSANAPTPTSIFAGGSK